MLSMRMMRETWTLAATLSLVAIACDGSGCRSRSASAARDVDAADSSIAVVTDASPDVAPRRGHRSGSDVTFAVVSDTHFGYADMTAQNQALVRRLNAIEGRRYPASLGGIVGAPRGLVITGDLTEWGKVDEWEAFVATYGRDGTEGALRFPVLEMIGNHDKVHGPWVEEQVAKRHGGRFRSWDWDDLHLIALGEAPDEEGIAFLARDLANVDADVPVVLFFHLALEGPWSTDNWFADGGFKERLFAAIAGHDVVGIFHGHHHATAHYRWRGIDVWKPGAVKNGAHTFAVAHLTDTHFTVASFDWDRERWGEVSVKERKKR